jgi:hypothetical protein
MERGLRVRHNRFDLDHEKAGSRRVPRKNIDRPTLPPDRERHLDRRIPASLAQQDHRRVDDLCVCLVEESVQALAVPAELQLETRTERGSHRAQDPERNCGNLTALDLGDHASGYVREPGYVFLSKPTPNAKRPKPATKNDIHRAESAKKGSSAGARALHADFTPHLPANNPPRRVRSAR